VVQEVESLHRGLGSIPSTADRKKYTKYLAEYFASIHRGFNFPRVNAFPDHCLIKLLGTRTLISKVVGNRHVKMNTITE
jgi:hypothetical protein